MRSLPPGIEGALADSPKELIFDGGPAWRPEKALDRIYRAGLEEQVPEIRAGLEAAMRPATPAWFEQRFGIFFVLFHPTRDVDDRAYAIWKDEMTRLVIDLPHDIAAFAIDEAARKTATGFMPTIGQVRFHAEPLLAQRLAHIERLGQLEAALADPVATAERNRRRFDIEANERRIARDEQRDRERAAEGSTETKQ